MRNPTAAVFALFVLLITPPTSLAEEAGVTHTGAMTPLQILHDCIDAMRNRDFARYVDHLCPDEQRLQAGYAALVSSMMFPSLEAGADQIDPQTLLLLRAMNDLVEQHVASEGPRTGELHAVKERGPELFKRILAATLAEPEAGYAAPVYATPQVASPVRLRKAYIRSAGALKDPAAFLVAALTEVSRAVHVAGGDPQEPTCPSYFAHVADALQQQTWTLYTRGDYAIAVPPRRQDASRNEGSGPDTEAAPPDAGAAAWPTRIEFRKTDGVWRISHLLPASMLMSSASGVPNACETPGCAPMASPYYPSAAPYAPPVSAPPSTVSPYPAPQYAPTTSGFGG